MELGPAAAAGNPWRRVSGPAFSDIIGGTGDHMIQILKTSDFLRLAETTPVVDVRSPGEFAEGSIAAASSIPLLDNDQRAEVGTLYKQRGRQPALLRGLGIVGQKMQSLAEAGLALAAGQPASAGDANRPDLLVYCWRGGSRSRSFAWLMEQLDLNVAILEGGYRAYRQAGQRLFAAPWNLMVLGGLTGSGKTDQLQHLSGQGEQVVDLECLANHRGSAFGGVGLGRQPTVEAFENRLHDRLRDLDPGRRVWIEAESQSIGRVFIPLPFFRQAIAAPMIVMQVPAEQRIERLTREYSRFSADELKQAVTRIRKRLGGQHVQRAIQAIDAGDFRTCAAICLAYYDKSYGQGSKYLAQRSSVGELDVPDSNDPEVANRLLRIADRQEFGKRSRPETVDPVVRRSGQRPLPAVSGSPSPGDHR